MGFFDFLTGGKKKGGETVVAEPQIPAWQMGLGQDLSGWVREFLKLYNPGEKYPGQLSVKTPSIFEQAGLSELGNLLSGPATGELFDAAKGQVLDTLGGKYADPSTSPFIQSITRLSGQNLQDLINKSRASAGARGSFFTRSAIQEESNLSERTQNFLNSVIGEFMNSERGRQLSSVPYAQELEKYGTLTAPLARIGAATTTGSLPRILEQADLERQYSDYLRGRTELSAVPGVGTSVFGRNIPYDLPGATLPTQQQPSGLASILQALNSGGFSFGGGGGAGGGGTDFGDWKEWADLAMKVLPMVLV